MASASRPQSMSVQNAQVLGRRDEVWFDQHDREWSVSVEVRSGDPTGNITPRFRAPWTPAQAYLKPQRGARGQRGLFIDYEAMLRDVEAEWESFRRQAVEIATARGWDVPIDVREPGALDPRILQIVGAPRKRPQPIVAAMQGNRWILGETRKPDPRLAPFVEDRKAKRRRPVEQALTAYGDFSDAPEPDEAEEALLDLEETHDPGATGGRRERLSRGPKGATKGTTTKRAATNAALVVSEG